MKQGLFFVLIIFHLIILSNLNFTAWPEMLSYPYLYLNEFSFYKDFIMPYPPVLILFLTLIYKLFGVSVLVLKNFTWILNLINDLLVFLTLRRLNLDTAKSLVLTFFYIVASSFLDGNMLWFDNATVTPLLLYLYFVISWLRTKEKKELCLAGLFLGITILVKQTAGLYLAAFMLFWLHTYRLNFNTLKFFLFGFILINISFVLYLLVNSSAINFFEWALIYPMRFWSDFPGYVEFQISRREFIILVVLVLPLAGFIQKHKIFYNRKEFTLILLTFLASLIAVYPRFSFFHLQPAIAVLVLLMGILLKKTRGQFGKFLIIYLIFSLFLITYFFRNDIGKNDLRFYSEKDIQIGYQIKNIVGVKSKTFFLGVNSSEYVFSQTIPSKPWVDNFGWYLEIPGVQNNVIEGLKKEKIKFVFIKKPEVGEWYNLGAYQPKLIKDYIYNNYELNGIIEDNIELWQIKE